MLLFSLVYWFEFVVRYHKILIFHDPKATHSFALAWPNQGLREMHFMYFFKRLKVYNDGKGKSFLWTLRQGFYLSTPNNTRSLYCNIKVIDCYAIRNYNVQSTFAIVNFSLFLGLLLCKYVPFWQVVSKKSPELRCPLRPVGLLFE